MDRYPIARDRIRAHFGSIKKFCLISEIPKVTVLRVLQGKYGYSDTDDSRQKERIEQAMLRLGAPQEALRNLWARAQEQIDTRIIYMQGKRIKISTMVEIEELKTQET